MATPISGGAASDLPGRRLGRGCQFTSSGLPAVTRSINRSANCPVVKPQNQSRSAAMLASGPPVSRSTNASFVTVVALSLACPPATTPAEWPSLAGCMSGRTATRFRLPARRLVGPPGWSRLETSRRSARRTRLRRRSGLHRRRRPGCRFRQALNRVSEPPSPRRMFPPILPVRVSPASPPVRFSIPDMEATRVPLPFTVAITGVSQME